MKKYYLLFLLIIGPLLLNAQVTKYKAVFTLNFIRYVGWPEVTKQGDFVIGVIKGKETASWLREQSAGKKFGFQNVVIKEFKSVEEMSYCQVVYVSSYVNMSRSSSELLNKLGGKNSLIICESEGATDHGAMINFVVREGKLKFEIHKQNAAKLGLVINSKLENMAAAIVK